MTHDESNTHSTDRVIVITTPSRMVNRHPTTMLVLTTNEEGYKMIESYLHKTIIVQLVAVES